MILARHGLGMSEFAFVCGQIICVEEDHLKWTIYKSSAHLDRILVIFAFRLVFSMLNQACVQQVILKLEFKTDDRCSLGHN